MERGRPESGRLFQEDLREDPFWMLVACSLVNLTTWRQARPVLLGLRGTYGSPEALAGATEEGLHGVLRPLGLWRRRARSLIGMANAWLRDPPRRAKDVSLLPGCGRYASDSWRIFVDGERPDPSSVSDHKLGWYLRQQKE